MSAAVMIDPAEIVQGQLDAYNAQDLERLCGFFTSDVVVANYNGEVTGRGLAAHRERLVKLFAEFPNNRADLVNRIAVGATVIDHERVTRAPDIAPYEVAVIYTLADGKIARVDFAK